MLSEYLNGGWVKVTRVISDEQREGQAAEFVRLADVERVAVVPLQGGRSPTVWTCRKIRASRGLVLSEAPDMAKIIPEPSGRYHAVLIAPGGGATHLAARERIEEAMDDADTEGKDVDAQVLALRPRRVVASREAGAAWRRV